MSPSSSSGYRALNIALGKTLIAAAWVDGELNDQELDCLKSLILQMPQITFDDWRKLKIYMAYPITTPEQNSIVESFTEKVYLKGHQKLAWNSLLQVLQADGSVNFEEKAFAVELENALEESSGSFLRKIKYFLFQAKIENAPAWQKTSPGRDKFIHEFFDNPVYFIFRKAILKEGLEVPHSKPELQKVCLLAAILCWFAKSDDKLSLSEEAFILKILIEHCEIQRNLSECIFKVGKSIDVTELQLSELTSSFADTTPQIERNDFFVIISKMILIDSSLSPQELECLRTVALYLEISETLWRKVLGDIHLKTTFSA